MKTSIIPLVLLMLSCTTSSALRSEGFAASPAGSGTWWVSFEGDGMSLEQARDNLLYNTAKLIIDKGGSYFTFEEAETDRRIARQQSSGTPRTPSLDPTRDPYSTETRLQRSSSVTAVAEIVESPGSGVLNASKVLEELTSKYTR